MEKENTKAFFDTFLRGSGVSGVALIAFATGLIAIGILSNAAYDVFVDTPSIMQHGWKIGIAFLGLIAFAYLLFRWDLKRHARVNINVDDSKLAPTTKGIVWLLGPRLGPLPFVLAHHRKKGGGTYCWLIMQKNHPEIEDTFMQMKAYALEKDWLDLSLQHYYIETLTAQDTYSAVNTILTREAKEAGLDATQIICDITGGTKPLTAGMMLGAIASNSKVEYVESDRDDHGRPIEGTQRVVLVDTKFYLTRETPS